MDKTSAALPNKPLVGTEEALIDDKNRLLISKKKRERLGDDFVLAFGNLGCLVAYPQWAWDRMCSEVLSYSAINQGRDMITRLLMADAVDELNCDQQGRLTIPQPLRDKSKISGDVILVGLGDRVEIWAKSAWEEFNKYPDVYGRERREGFENAYLLMTGQGG